MVRWSGVVASLFGLLVVLSACEVQPCDRYVDYMCTCHADDTGVDCDELQAVLGDAGQSTQDQCAVDLADQEQADAEAGLTCDVVGPETL